MGDRLATLALLLRPLGALYFAGLVAGWALVTLVVVLPAAIVAGWQFPLLPTMHGATSLPCTSEGVCRYE